MNSTTLSGDEVATKLIGAFPKLDAIQQKTGVQLYRLLSEGEPVELKKLAYALEESEIEVKNRLENWSGIYYDDNKRVIGFWGLALPEMGHQFTVNGKTLYNWCAWDGLFIPLILQKEARIKSTSPNTKKPIQMTVTQEGVKELLPQESVMSILVPSAEEVSKNVIQSFCHHVHFFESEASGSKWISGKKGHILVSVDEGFQLGKKLVQSMYKDVLTG